MPEYLALVHFHTETSENGEDAPAPTAEDMNEAFARMHAAGITRVLN